ncbi:hypothetical protein METBISCDRAFT_31743 [Metschnikowia bicuspidata]|uniref:Letm1 RBD domain-containing protein n=1 Tax=Metschnikowia bicuspidata TaxID=27322 RepID=A0A4P9Z9S7_9ASCO|nr:hypothetical protein METBISCDRAFT_31743 [Metschnikowia bicuspidata]
MNRAALLSFTSKARLLEHVAHSPTLASLWAQSDKPEQLNCLRSLPLAIRSKQQVDADMAAANIGAPRVAIKFRLGWAYAQELGRFYKHGLTAVWQNFKETRHLCKSGYKHTGVLGRSGADTAVMVPSFNELSKAMAQQVYMRAVEDKAHRDATRGGVVRREDKSSLSLIGQLALALTRSLFNLTRAEFQLLRRTPADFMRLPLFAVIAMVFMEVTPLVCYAFPEVTPLACVLPSILPRVWPSKNRLAVQKAVHAEMVNESADDFAMKTAYSIPPKTLRALAQCLRLKSKYIPTAMFPDFILRKRLHSHFLYLLVDNFYLGGLNGNGNLWDLVPQELVLACLERNLVQDSKALADTTAKGTAAEQKLAMDDLRLKLALFIANFESCNVGYLAVDHLLPDVETEAVMRWRA